LSHPGPPLIKSNPYPYSYISIIKTKQHEWIILNAVDSRRKNKKWKGGGVSRNTGRVALYPLSVLDPNNTPLGGQLLFAT